MRRTSFATPQRRVHCLLDVNDIMNSIISVRSLELIRDEMKMQLNIASVLWSLFSTVGDSISTVEAIQCCGGIASVHVGG